LIEAGRRLQTHDARDWAVGHVSTGADVGKQQLSLIRNPNGSFEKAKGLTADGLRGAHACDRERRGPVGFGSADAGAQRRRARIGTASVRASPVFPASVSDASILPAARIRRRVSAIRMHCGAIAAVGRVSAGTRLVRNAAGGIGVTARIATTERT
jgi:hypothetical protein